MKFGLSQEDFTRIKSVLKKFIEIEEVIIYGSRVKGTHRKGSDIDLALKGQEIDSHLLNKLSDDLDELYLPYTFDLVAYSRIDNQELIDHIDRIGVVF